MSKDALIRLKEHLEKKRMINAPKIGCPDCGKDLDQLTGKHKFAVQLPKTFNLSETWEESHDEDGNMIDMKVWRAYYIKKFIRKYHSGVKEIIMMDLDTTTKLELIDKLRDKLGGEELSK